MLENKLNRLSVNSETTYLEKKDENGNTALLNAVREGKLRAVASLLAANANILARDKEGWSSLHFAAANGYLEIMQLLIKKSKRLVDQADDEDRTPLQKACYYGRTEAVALLLANQANIEKKDGKDKTPLHAAVSYGGIFNAAVIRLLIQQGANLQAKTDYGWTPLHSASRYGNPQTVQLLIELGADTEAKNNYGETALNCIASEARLSDAEKIPILQALLESKADVHTQDSAGRTPLHWACNRGEYTVARHLLKNGAHVDQFDGKGKTPLHHAAEGNHDEIIMLLADWTKRLGQKKNSGATVTAENTRETFNSESLLMHSLAANPSIQAVTRSSTQAEIEKSSPIHSPTPEPQSILSELYGLVKLQADKIKQLEANQETLLTEVKQLRIAQVKTSHELTLLKQQVNANSIQTSQKLTFFE